MNQLQLRELIEHVLRDIDMYSESAVELLMLTAAVESNLGEYIKQKGGGPALGIFQMEPDTEDDIWFSYLYYRDAKQRIVEKYDSAGEFDLWANLGYQIVLCRFHYYRVPEPLPAADDIRGLAFYWKRYYNTRKGKGTVKKAIAKYEKYVGVG